MGILDKIGGWLKSGITKVAGFVGKVAPIVQQVAGFLPSGIGQTISKVAGIAGNVGNAITGGGGAQGVADQFQGTSLGPIANKVANVYGAVQGALGGGQAQAPQPIM
jgi:hypothetical protein